MHYFTRSINAIKCPTCGASIGKDCVNSTHKVNECTRLWPPHKERVQLYKSMVTKRYRVVGTYEIVFSVHVDRDVYAENEEEALRVIDNEISSGTNYPSAHRWVDAGPDIQAENT